MSTIPAISVIPANPEWNVLKFLPNEADPDNSGHRYTEIIAWEIRAHVTRKDVPFIEVYPITSSGREDGDDAYIEEPSGRITLPNVQTYRNYAAWLADRVEELKRKKEAPAP